MNKCLLFFNYKSSNCFEYIQIGENNYLKELLQISLSVQLSQFHLHLQSHFLQACSMHSTTNNRYFELGFAYL